MNSTINKLFPFLTHLSEDEKSLLVFVEADNGQTILAEGISCNHALFLYEGEIKIVKFNKNGRKVNLNTLVPGQACILTVTSALSGQPFPAYMVARNDIKAFMIEKHTLQNWLSKYPPIQTLIYQATANRFDSLMSLFDFLCFRRNDEKVVEYLLENFHENDTVLNVTHEEIAIDLGTAREVISRVMKNLEKNGAIRLSRGKVFMHSRSKLESILKREH